MSDFGKSPKLKYIREIWRFYKILWKDTGHFRPNNRTFRTFQNPDSQTLGSGYNSNTKPNTAIKNSKNRFQKCPKNYTNIIGKLGNYIKFYGKIPDIFILITGHCGLFKIPTLRLGEAGTTQTQSQTQRLNISKIDFKSVRKTIFQEPKGSFCC